MIHMFCPDDQTPTGGIKVLYEHVDVLNSAGLDAVIVHEEPGFRVNWFENATRVISRSEFKPTEEDFAVIPEVYGPDASDYAPGVRKVVFNQSGSLTFHGYSFNGAPLRTPYVDPEVIACFAISDRVVRYLNHVFPGLPVHRVQWSVDTERFRPADRKRRQVAYMPRKHPEEARQVFNMLRYRGVLDDVNVVALDGMSELEVARGLGESMWFFSFGYPEGLPLPPAEAMACGCVVVGYHGWGGREFFREDFCWPVPNGDVLAFAMLAEEALLCADTDPSALVVQGTRAREYVVAHYGHEQEKRGLLAAWKALGVSTDQVWDEGPK